MPFCSQEMIKNGEIPSFKVFTHEPAKKRQKRLAKENREAKESEELLNECGIDSGSILILYQLNLLQLFTSVFLYTRHIFGGHKDRLTRDPEQLSVFISLKYSSSECTFLYFSVNRE